MEDARAYATWAAMEREFSLGRGAASGRLLLPRHSRVRFIELLEWMALDRDTLASRLRPQAGASKDYD
jgi:hypothetical protein